MQIADHKLVEVQFEATENKGGVIKPEFLVLHYTVTRSLEATVAAFRSKARPASAHLIVAPDGRLVQMVPFNCKAWHAGESQWAGRAGCNNFTIGIEVVNPGPVFKRSSGFVDVNERPWDGDVVEARHKNGIAKWTHWAAYSSAQIERIKVVGALLVEKYGLRDVVGHDDIAPSRKMDPGPAFPMDSVRSALFSRASDDAEEYETTTVLNIRKGPAVSFDQVAGGPLPQGKRVRFVDQEGLWWHVIDPTSALEGWVHSRFLVRA
jgi:N-acetylmuramoyl-L-alanine amidase